MLRVGQFGPVNGQNPNVNGAQEVKTETPVSVWGSQKPSIAAEVNTDQNKKYRDFNNALKETALTDKFIDADTLEAQGWKKEPMMDMNGGKYYTNPKTGVTVRVKDRRLASFNNEKSMSVKTENMAHFAIYDKNGKETGGVIQTRQPDGSIKVYHYDVDISGNRFIKSEEISDLDYFADYE